MCAVFNHSILSAEWARLYVHASLSRRVQRGLFVTGLA